MPRKRKQPESIHYRLGYNECNPASIRIEKIGAQGTEDSYFYLATDLGGLGACNCPHSLMHIYKKRRELVEKSLETVGFEETMKNVENIRKESGICHHEIMVLEAEKLQEKVRTELDRRYGEKRWKIRTLVLIAEALRKIHETLEIQAFTANETEWVEHALKTFLDTLEKSSPQLGDQPMTPPDWIWTNQKVLERTERLTATTIATNLEETQKVFSEAMRGIQTYLTSQAEAAIASGHTSAPEALIEGFYTDMQPWLAPAFRAAVGFISLKTTPIGKTPITLQERETLHRFGGKGRIFLEVCSG